MTNKMPLRLTILHFAQRFLIDAVTFIPPISFLHWLSQEPKIASVSSAKVIIILASLNFVQTLYHSSQQGQDDRTVLSDSQGMLKMASQRAIG